MSSRTRQRMNRSGVAFGEQGRVAKLPAGCKRIGSSHAPEAWVRQDLRALVGWRFDFLRQTVPRGYHSATLASARPRIAQGEGNV